MKIAGILISVLLLAGCQQKERGLAEFHGERFSGKLVELNSTPALDSNVWIAVTSANVHVDLDANCEHFYLDFQQPDSSTLILGRPVGRACPDIDRSNLATVVSFLGSGTTVQQSADMVVLRSPDGRNAKFKAQYSSPFVD